MEVGAGAQRMEKPNVPRQNPIHDFRPRYEVHAVNEENNRFKQFALEVIEIFEYAMDGNFSAMPALEDLSWAVDFLTRFHGYEGTEPWILPLRRSISGPDVKSYKAVAELLEQFIVRLYPPDANENQAINPDVPF